MGLPAHTLTRLTTATASAHAALMRAVADTDRTLYDERHAEGWDGRHGDYPPGPTGLRYRCHECGLELGSAYVARKHEAKLGHVMLRVDWFDAGYWDVLEAMERERAA